MTSRHREPGLPLGRHCHVMRHGQSEANVQGRIVSSLADGAEGFGLTEEGREQVRGTLGAALAAGTLTRATEVLTSPFLRAVETAEIAGELLGDGFRVDERLRERFFGALDHSADSNYERVWALDRLDPGHTEWGVESVAAVAERVLAALADATGEMEAEAEATAIAPADARPLLLVTHGDAASILIAALAGDLKRHRELGGLPVAGLRELGTR